jgi:adenosylcobinamide kinase/adenosylcobinamide-phosphate guanylyltransferase
MGLTLLLGGVRSGKSALAVELAAASGRAVVFVATAEAGDEEMARRIARHRTERPGGWRTIETPRDVATAVREAPAEACVVVDCLSVWVANLLDLGDDEIIAAAGDLASALAARAESIAVTNEVGMGVHPSTAIGRRYRDIMGAANAAAARAADRALLVVAGRVLPLLPAAGARP